MFKNCQKCGEYKRIPTTETLCYSCRERRDNLINMSFSQHCSTCQQETAHYWWGGGGSWSFCSQCTENGRRINILAQARWKMNSQLEEILEFMFKVNDNYRGLYVLQIKAIYNLFTKQQLFYNWTPEPVNFSNSREVGWHDYLLAKHAWTLLSGVSPSALNMHEVNRLHEGIKVFKEENAEVIEKWEKFLKERENTQLSRLFEESEQKLSESIQQIQVKQERIRELEAELANSQTESNENKRIKEELTQQKQALEEQIRNNTQTYQQEVERLQASIEQLKQETKQHLNKIKDLEEKFLAKTIELGQELVKTRRLTEDLTNLRTQKQTNENNLKQAIRTKEGEIQKLLTESKESTAGLRKEIEDLKQKLAESQEVSKKDLEEEQKKLKEIESRLEEQIRVNQAQKQTIEQLETNLAESEKVLGESREELRQSQKRITQLETQLLNHEQLKEKHTSQIEALTSELAEIKEQLSQSGERNQQLEQELNEVKETLSVKQASLKEERLKVVGLQAKLKNMPKPEPIKPSLSESKPIDQWMLGIILIAGIGLYLLLNRRKK